MRTPNAFLFYVPGVNAAPLFESMTHQAGCVTLTPAEVLRPSLRVRNILEMRDPIVVNVTHHSFAQIRHLHGMLEQAGYQPQVCLRAASAGRLSESQIRDLTTEGLLQEGFPRSVVRLESARPATQLVQHVVKTLSEEGSTLPIPVAKSAAPKVPTEVDRLKAQQQQDIVMTKQRQALELLQAKQRELSKKSREDMNKISSGA